MSDSAIQTTNSTGSEETTDTLSSPRVTSPKPARGWVASKNGSLQWNQTGSIMAGDIRSIEQRSPRKMWSMAGDVRNSVEQKKQRKMWTTVDRSSLSVHLLKANLAEDGCEEAQLDIAKKLLEESEGIATCEATQHENTKKAVYWLIKSAEQGNEEATELLKQRLKAGEGITHQNVSDVRSCIVTPKKEKLVFKAARRLYEKLSNGEEFITTTQILELLSKDLSEDDKDSGKQETDQDPDSPNRTFIINEDEETIEGPQFPKWVSGDSGESKSSSPLRDREGVKLTKADLLSVAKTYNEGMIPAVAISGQVWGTRHYQSLFYYLSIFLIQFLLLSVLLKALNAYTVLLILTSWTLLWSTYGFLVWHKGFSIFEEWTRAFQVVLRNNSTKDFSSEPKLVSRNLLPVYALSLIGLALFHLLNAPPTLVILMAIFNCFGIIRGVRNYKIRLQTIFMVVSTLCTSTFVIGGCLHQLSAIPEEDLASANEVLSVGMLALKRTLEEYIGILPSISIHVTVAVVNFAIMAESYVHSRRVTDVLEQLVLYAWFGTSVHLLPSMSAGGFACIFCVTTVLATFFYLVDANKSLWTVFLGTYASFLVVMLVVLSAHMISAAATVSSGDSGELAKPLSWKEYSEYCHRKAWETTPVAETRIQCSRRYERSPTHVLWAGKVASVKVSSIEPVFSDQVRDEILFEVLVHVASSPWEVDSEEAGGWTTLLTGNAKDKESLSIVSVILSTKDVVGQEAKTEAVNRLLSLSLGDTVRIQGILANGAGGLKPEVGSVKLSRCYYCEDDRDAEMIFLPTDSLSTRLLSGLEEYLGSELLILLGEAEAVIRHYLGLSSSLFI